MTSTDEATWSAAGCSSPREWEYIVRIRAARERAQDLREAWAAEIARSRALIVEAIDNGHMPSKRRAAKLIGCDRKVLTDAEAGV